MGGVVLTFAGRAYPLLFNGAALFAAQELTDKNLVEAVTEYSKEGFGLLCRLVAILSEQAELCRRYEGYAPAEPLTAERLLCTAMPYDIEAMRLAALDALTRGYRREQAEEEEIDLGLLELQKKSDPA